MSPAPSIAQRRNPLTLRSEEVASILADQRTTLLRYEQIRTDGGTQMRALLQEATAAEYAEELRAGVVLPPVLVFFDGQDYWLGDGFHRVRAHYLVSGEAAQIPCLVRAGTRRDAVLCAAAANAAHGLRRTNADKRRAVETLLQDAEWGQWSDREIARRCHVHHQLVATMRKELSLDDHPVSNPLTGSQADSSRALSVIAAQDVATGKNGTNHPALSLDDHPVSDERTYVTKHGTVATMKIDGQRQAGQGKQNRPASKPTEASEGEMSSQANRVGYLLGLYRSVLSSLAEYGALTGRHTHTPAVRRALEPLIEALREQKG